MALSSVSAAVLIGGHSRRMGEPKALLRLSDGEPTLIERTVAALRAVSDDVFLVGAVDGPMPESLNTCPLALDSVVSSSHSSRLL